MSAHSGTPGQVGERLSASLQSSTHRFDSGPGLSSARRDDTVAKVAEHFGFSRSDARRYIGSGTCPCGGQGANPCWRMGGEAACVSATPAPYDGRL